MRALAAALLVAGAAACGSRRAAPRAPAPVIDVAVGRSHACALYASGRVRCWGDNRAGQLGDGSTAPRAAPVEVAGVDDAVELAVGVEHSCARRRGGGVLCWGGDLYDQIGDGRPATVAVPSPQAVAGVDDAVELAAGELHTCARRAGGAVVCWGDDLEGQLGDGSPGTHHAPVPVVGVAGAVALGAGTHHTCAAAGGRALCWGSNHEGQLGGGARFRAAPVELPALAGAVELAGGQSHTCARRADGTVWCRDGAGRVAAVPDLDDAVELAAGAFVACARRAGGAVLCWGYGPDAVLGDGSPAGRAGPAAVVGLDDAVHLAGGGFRVCAVRPAAPCSAGAAPTAAPAGGSRSLRPPRCDRDGSAHGPRERLARASRHPARAEAAGGPEAGAARLRLTAGRAAGCRSPAAAGRSR